MTGLAERLWSRVDRSAGPDGCWPWTGARLPKGYGRMGVGSRKEQTRRVELTHRIAYAVHTGEDIGGGVVRHRCDNPPCCNPAHLLLGTMADNSADMKERGRGRAGCAGCGTTPPSSAKRAFGLSGTGREPSAFTLSQRPTASREMLPAMS